MARQKSKSSKKAPIVGVKIISILLLIFALWILIGSLISFIGALSHGLNFDEKELEEVKIRFENRGREYSEESLMVLLVFGFIMVLAFGGFMILLAMKLWKGKNWSRVTTFVIAFVFGGVNLMDAALGNYYSLIDAAALLVIGFYLALSKNVREMFKRKT